MLDNSQIQLSPLLESMKKPVKTCFVLTHIPDPKTNKRIRVFKNYGDTSVICTRRKNQDVWEPAFDDVEHCIFDVDLPTTKHMFKRLLVSRKYQNKAASELVRRRPDVIYADGLDSVMIAVKYKKKHHVTIVYDVADLRAVYIEKPRSLIKKIITYAVKKMEKKCFKSIDWLVITSPKFYDVYYKSLIKKDYVLFIPNAPENAIFQSYRKKQEGGFTVGFIGGIRYLAQMKMLVDAAGETDVQVLFAGAGGTSNDFAEISKYCEGRAYVSFTGKYKYERDIAGLYGRVDCVYAVYDADNPNVRIALPNKLYEAILCELPIVVAKGTYLAELVEKWGVGIAVNHKDKTDLIETINLLKLNTDLRDEIVRNCKKMKVEISIDIYNSELTKTIEG